MGHVIYFKLPLYGSGLLISLLGFIFFYLCCFFSHGRRAAVVKQCLGGSVAFMEPCVGMLLKRGEREGNIEGEKQGEGMYA